jgi:cytochrome c oxidase subunit 2
MPLFHPASLQGLTMRGDWYLFLIAAAVIGVIVYVLILLPLVVWRERPGHEAATFTGNPTLEIAYTVVPLLIVVGLFVVTYAREMRVDYVSASPQVTVDAIAFRWSWRFDYPASGISLEGTPAQPPTLYLPIGRTAQINVSSVDVNHSFWVPAFLFKRDAIPGMTNRFDITPNRLGSFVGRCAQFCGIDHALMTFTVKVVSGDAYDRYVASRGTVLP